MPFRFQLAGPEHEAGLRRLLAETSMPGPIRLAYTREPDFFAGLALEGPFTQTFVALEDEVVVGMGTRAVRRLYVNGEVEDVGYLGGLRVKPGAQRRLGLSRGYRLLKGVHGDGRCPGYLSTILEGNREAAGLLGSGRAGLPSYRDLGRLHSHLLLVPRRARRHPELRRARAEDLPVILDFLHAQGPCRQFFPVLDPTHFGTAHLHGFRIEDFRLLERGAVLKGVLGVWDQRDRKQLRVRSYAPWLGALRPLINGFQALRGFRGLPPVGAEVPLAAGTFLRVAGDDPRDLEALISGTLADLEETDLLGMALMFHERDPLASAAGAFPALRLESRLYGVGWEDSEPWFRALDPALVPYVDAAFL